ncbi:MAG: hypothetical protein J0I54_11485 [Bosea sp.]|nr:hypothetical protein [Bosea sp. (in: a-proteobacteria)]
MCNSVIADGRSYDTPRQLAVLLGGQDKLIWQSQNPFVRWPQGKDWRDLDLCLCGINLPATLEKTGLRWRVGDDDPMEHFID